MAAVQVDCILKPNPGDAEAGITHVGGPGGGDRWLLSQREILDRITWRVETFFLLTGNEREELAVRGESPHTCLQSHTDWQGNDRLLSLPDCPAADLWSWVQAVAPRWRRGIA